MQKAFEYFACDGGPHVIIPSDLQDRWHGMGKELNPIEKGTHFAQACAISGDVGVVEADGAKALVLAGSPPISGYGSSDSEIPDLYVFESWKDPESISQLASLASDCVIPARTGLRWHMSGKSATLMFAGDTAERLVYGGLKIPIPQGTYDVFVGRYENSNGAVKVIRLARIAV